MDAETLRAALNAGGFALLAVVMTVLHLYNVRVAIPQMQAHFHDELSRERTAWIDELHQQRDRDDSRHKELMTLLYDGKGCKFRATENGR